MELLRAKSDDKKVIFRKLFNTELYQNIVDELMNRKRSLEKEIAQIKTACQTEAAHVVIPQEYDQWQEIEGLKKAGFEWGNCSDGLLSGSSGRVMQNTGEKCEFYLERITIRIKTPRRKKKGISTTVPFS